MSHTGKKELTDRLTQLGCAALVDAMGRVHSHRAHMLAMTSPSPGTPVCGPAVTIAYMPYRDDLPESERDFGFYFDQAVGTSPDGRVLVLSSGGSPDVSHGGGTKLLRVATHRMAGVIADGRLRDFGELRANEVAAWCWGEATHWGGSVVMPYAANIAVECAGVCIVPGDLVYADASGGVVIPAGSVDRVLQEAESMNADDARAAEQIRKDTPPPS
ncbi:RraA family protein [Streptomyces sp. IBSBF 3136]|uniref:RraA family protein n=1 Tax=Streptomyces sp. IBSBF 3136 TaxID=2903524 RepID=UPI002FDC1846